MSYERKIKVVPHGYLKGILPEMEMSGFSVAEIINGISQQFPNLKTAFNQERHCISIPGFDSIDKLTGPISKKVNEIHLVPTMAGGKSGFFQIILGVVLVATALWLAPAGIGTAGSLFSISSASLLKTGIFMILGGLLQLMSPQPHTESGNAGAGAADPAASKYLGATQNTVKIGTRIPLLYGKHIAYGQYLSFDVDAKDIHA